MKAILINGQPKYQSQYKVLFDLNGNQTSTNGMTDEVWLSWGFKDVVEPIYDSNTQVLGEWYETDTQILRVVIDKTPEVLASELELRKVQLVAKYESDTDNLINTVVGNRAQEYQLAEEEAIAFKAAGYPDTDVPVSISSDAFANGRTNTEACDLILLMADNWRTAQMSLRSNRLLSKAQTKAAVDMASLDTIVQAWDAFLEYLRTQITE